MSQEKVDRYKEQKANRKQIMKKEKAENFIRKCIVAVCGLLLVVWVGYSAYNMYDSGKEPDKVQIDYRAFNDFAQKITEAGEADAAAAAAEEAE